MYAAEARKLIFGHANDTSLQHTPFFLYMAFQNCHAPYQVPDKYQAMYPHLPEGKSQRCFNAMVSAMDEAAGAIVDALKTTKMYENSVIVYSSVRSVLVVRLSLID